MRVAEIRLLRSGAYRHLRRFDDAIAAHRQAAEMLREAGDEALAAEVDEELAQLREQRS